MDRWGRGDVGDIDGRQFESELAYGNHKNAATYGGEVLTKSATVSPVELVEEENKL